MASDEVSVPAAAADTGERRTGKTTMRGNDVIEALRSCSRTTAIGNDVAGELRMFQKEHIGTGIRIVYKIAI